MFLLYNMFPTGRDGLSGPRLRVGIGLAGGKQGLKIRPENDVLSQAPDGVLCCKTHPAAAAHEGGTHTATATVVVAPVPVGRALTPVNVTTYGWYYTF